MDLLPLIIETFSAYEPVIEGIQFALSVLINNWWIALLAVLYSIFLGVNPGLGGSVGIAILIPFFIVTDMPTSTAFLIYGCTLGGTTFAGAVSAILANVPGSGSNAATLLDGYPLSQKGQANLAISSAAFASAIGALIGLVLFLLFLPLVLDVVLLFGPPEMFWVIIIGLAIIPIVAGDRVLMGFAAGGLGLFFGLYGHALATGELRYHYGLPALADGFHLVPVLIGLFAFSEIMRLSMEGKGSIAGDSTRIVGGRLDGLREVIKHKWVLIRGSIIGTLVGAVPGAGGSVATWVSYAQAVATSNNPSSFGKGNIAGVIASESANDAKDGGQLFPTMGLGIPGSGSTAVLLGAFLAHGIVPGPSLLQNHMGLMLTVFIGIFVANILSSAIGLLAVNYLTIITKLKIVYLYPGIVLIGLYSVYFLRNSAFDMVVAVGFGFLGYLLLNNNISRVPVIIAFVLGPILEQNFWIAYDLGGGDIINAFFTGFITWSLIVIFIITLGYAARKTYSDTSIYNDESQINNTLEEEGGNDQP